jgi:hypothetical protein
MLQRLKAALRDTPVKPIYRYFKRTLIGRGRSQSNEGEILKQLIGTENPPPTFIEFGFHPEEFNCIDLMGRFQGLLVDGSAQSVATANAEFPEGIKAVASFLTLENLDFIRSYFPNLGILSVDVDGNDYWFLEALIGLKPPIIVVEYNATMGTRSISVPYDETFDRHRKHASGWYHGASITALCKLARKHGYGLAAVSDAGLNLFFTRTGTLDPVASWRPNTLRAKWSNKTVEEQWDTIKHLDYVEV